MQVISLLRRGLARLLYEAWTRVAVRELESAGEVIPEIHHAKSATPDERLLSACSGRLIEVWLPLPLERRLKAALHRMNANVLSAGWAEEEQFDTEGDLGITLISAATCGVKSFEEQDGVAYDADFGLPIEGELMREES